MNLEGQYFEYVNFEDQNSINTTMDSKTGLEYQNEIEHRIDMLNGYTFQEIDHKSEEQLEQLIYQSMGERIYQGSERNAMNQECVLNVTQKEDEDPKQFWHLFQRVQLSKIKQRRDLAIAGEFNKTEIILLGEFRKQKKKTIDYPLNVQQLRELLDDFRESRKEDVWIKRQKIIQEKRSIKGLNNDEKYPLLSTDPQLTFLRLQLFQRIITVNDSPPSMMEPLYIMNASQPYQKIFTQCKNIVSKLLKNQNNLFLTEYIKYAKDYKEFYKKHINKKNPSEQKIQKNNILKILLEGIDKAKIIIRPSKADYGFTLQQVIFVNLNTMVANFTINKNFKINHLKNILKTQISLTLLHELSHYLIRGLQFQLEDDKSFDFQDKSSNLKEIVAKFRTNNKKVKILSHEISFQTIQFALRKKQQFKQLRKQLEDTGQIKNYQEIQRTVFLVLVSQKVFPLTKENEFSRILEVIKKQISSNQKFKNSKEKVKKSFDSDDSNNDNEQSRPIMTQIFARILDACDRTTQFYEIIWIQQNGRKSQSLLEQQFKKYLQNNLGSDVCSILQQLGQPALIYGIQYTKKDEIIKLINKIEIQKQINTIWDAGKFFNQRIPIELNQQIYMQNILKAIFNQQHNIYKAMLVLQFGKLGQQIAKFQTFENLNMIMHGLLEVDKQCEDYLIYKEILELQKEQKLESGWIMESKLFPNISNKKEKHFIRAYDFVSIKCLEIFKSKEKCMQIRDLFGNEKYARECEYDGPTALVSRRNKNKEKL